MNPAAQKIETAAARGHRIAMAQGRLLASGSWLSIGIAYPCYHLTPSAILSRYSSCFWLAAGSVLRNINFPDEREVYLPAALLTAARSVPSSKSSS